MKVKTEKQLIKFKRPKSLESLAPIVPSSKALPQWYKDMASPLTYNNTLEEIHNASTLRGCMPMFDAMTQGYIIPLWCDLHVSVVFDSYDNDGKEIPRVKFEWPPGMTNITHTLKEPNFPTQVVQNHNIPQTKGAPQMEQSLGGAPAFKLNSPWIIETPKNYSSLFVPVLNNPPKNISLFSAIVATDTYHDRINFPFVWTGTEEWEGIIPMGTPLMQVIPFKRDDFQHEIVDLSQDDLDKTDSVRFQIRQTFLNSYKRFFRHKVSST